ncbi:hypothetical protein ONS95_006526 [Cadophora gregata]|uniref:uncharacterized protein n=1 Tax=Cadophora gregata TaxID=51156 RepID=UPI0026DB0935|nr:uncharacterized protein ONS95_006526 [Cadophora gregata]KAK0101351.1 hypothetical protein ONS95_006526 [Cadophora gregata]KAK0106639.1 hypothetical protein ONS96_004260 [Cadophora gregata f. sp. sojae]
MGWFWGSSSDDDDKSKDPLRNLDPSLREFLKKESPVKYDAPNPPAQAPVTSTPSPTEGLLSKPPASPENENESSEPKVPPQSLYKDGRYAHLWKTYQSQHDVESASKSDQEKIDDVLEGYKYRKAEIGRAALENCALEQWEVNDCFRNGGWASRLTMCRKENRDLERCYTMQGKFLKALGYLSTFDRPPEVDEQIQMHADTLYHRMLDQEAAIEAAKASGEPIPEFPPLLSSTKKKSSPQPGTTHANLDENKLKPSDLPQKVQAAFKKRLDGLSDEEREVEERAIKAEIQAGEQVAQSLGNIYERQAEEKRIRKEQGKETIGDKISSVFGFR